MCGDFENMSIWNNFMKILIRYQNHHAIWKVQKTWNHIARHNTLICINKQNYGMVCNSKRVTASNICMISSMKYKNHHLKPQKAWVMFTAGFGNTEFCLFE